MENTILVCGITRSGLTLTMQLLDFGGFPVEGEYPAYECHGLGEIPWNKIKGKAVKVVDIHLQFPPKGKYHVIRLKRDLEQQTASIVKFTEYFVGHKIDRQHRKRILKSTIKDYKKIDTWAKRQHSSIEVNFEDLIESTESQIKRIREFIGFELDTKKASSIVFDRKTGCYDGLLELKMIV